MEMKKVLSSYIAFIGFLSLIILLTLTTFVQAQSIEKWTGPVLFTAKLTTEQQDTSGNKRLVTSTEIFQGTMSFYWDPTVQSPTQGPDDCMLELLSSDGTKICFNEVDGASSYNKKSGKGSVLFVGTGNIASTFQEREVTGITYLNGKGNTVVDSSQNLISISLGGACGGGGGGFFFSGTIPITALTLTK
jgi:hypothetical protein